MTNISKKKPKTEVLLEINEELISTISNIKKPDNTKQFLNSFFSIKERIMLAKRLAIILMLEHQYNFRKISIILKVSQSTIWKINKQLKRGQFSIIVKKYKNKPKENKLWEILEDLFDLPPIAGPGRWKHLNKMYSDKK